MRPNGSECTVIHSVQRRSHHRIVVIFITIMSSVMKKNEIKYSFQSTGEPVSAHCCMFYEDSSCNQNRFKEYKLELYSRSMAASKVPFSLSLHFNVILNVAVLERTRMCAYFMYTYSFAGLGLAQEIAFPKEDTKNLFFSS